MPHTSRSRTALPPAPATLSKFATDLRKALKSYAAEPLIPFILKQEHLDEKCAALLWPCVNGSSVHLVATSVNWIDHWDSKLQVAISGAEAEIDIYTDLTPDSARANDARERRRNFVEIRKKRNALPSKKLGVPQDWTIVQHTKESLESLLCKSLPLAALAALLNAAFIASGQPHRSYSADAIGTALHRLRIRVS